MNLVLKTQNELDQVDQNRFHISWFILYLKKEVCFYSCSFFVLVSGQIREKGGRRQGFQRFTYMNSHVTKRLQ